MGLLTEGGGAGDRKRKEGLRRAVLETVDEGCRMGSSMRVSEVVRKVGEGSGEPVDSAEVGEALRGLEMEGRVQVSGEGARRSVRRITGVA